MTRKGKTNPRRRKGRVALLAALLMGVMLAGPALPARAAESGGQEASYVPIDWEKEDNGGKLTVTLSQTADGEDKTEFTDDIANANIVVDVYQIAKAAKVEGYDTYSFEFQDPFGDLATAAAGEDVKWEDIAQTALGIVVDPATATAAAACRKAEGAKVAEEEVSSLPYGLYLVVARGDDMTDPAVYAPPAEEGEPRKTIANSAIYQYSFLPVLVALPARGVVGENEIPDIINEQGVGISNMTSNTGVNWQYELEIALKAAREPRLTSMRIEKTLDTFEAGRDDAATFIFKVHGALTQGSKTITYDNTFWGVLNATGDIEPIVITDLPIGMEVTVTEAYPGTNYKPADGVTEKTVELQMMEVQEDDPENPVIPESNVVHFVNTYDEEFKGGGSVKNIYTKDDSGNYTGNDPEQVYDYQEGAR